MWPAAAVVTYLGVPTVGWSPWWPAMTGFCCLATAEPVRQLLAAAWLTRNADRMLRMLQVSG